MFNKKKLINPYIGSIIKEDVRITGELKSENSLRIEGCVRGNIRMGIFIVIVN